MGSRSHTSLLAIELMSTSARRGYSAPSPSSRWHPMLTGDLLVAKLKGATVVLIVDDDDAGRDGFTRLLRSAVLEPHPFGSPEQFLDEVHAVPGACVILDITMPRMSGPEVQARLYDRN